MTLYEILFGNKDIPMTNDVSFDQEAKTLIIGTAFILVFGAVITAKLVTDHSKTGGTRRRRK